MAPDPARLGLGEASMLLSCSSIWHLPRFDCSATDEVPTSAFNEPPHVNNHPPASARTGSKVTRRHALEVAIESWRDVKRGISRASRGLEG